MLKAVVELTVKLTEAFAIQLKNRGKITANRAIDKKSLYFTIFIPWPFASIGLAVANCRSTDIVGHFVDAILLIASFYINILTNNYAGL